MIYFKDNGGNRLGYVNGEEIRDNSGNRLGYINGGEIRDNTGNRIGYLNGNDFRDNAGNRVGYINGNEIRDNFGNRSGYIEGGSASDLEMCAAAFLLYNLKATASQSSDYSGPTYSRRSSSDDGEFNLLGAILYGLLYGFVNWVKGPFIELSAIKYKIEATRKEWWGTFFRSILLTLLFSSIIAMILVNINEIVGGIALILIMLFFGVLPIIISSIRRMYDIGKAGWWILVPVYGFILCGFVRGKE